MQSLSLWSADPRNGSEPKIAEAILPKIIYWRIYITLSSSPGLGFLVVCETENPNASGNSSVSLTKRVDLPDPEGPHSTRGLGRELSFPLPSMEELNPEAN